MFQRIFKKQEALLFEQFKTKVQNIRYLSFWSCLFLYAEPALLTRKDGLAKNRSTISSGINATFEGRPIQIFTIKNYLGLRFILSTKMKVQTKNQRKWYQFQSSEWPEILPDYFLITNTMMYLSPQIDDVEKIRHTIIPISLKNLIKACRIIEKSDELANSSPNSQ